MSRPSWVARLKESGRTGVRGLLGPVVVGLVRLGVRPDHVTWIGLAITVAGGVLFGLGHFRAGAGVALLGCLMDSLDGAVARARNEVSPWGAFLDSTTDRIADAALFLGVAAHYFRQPVVMLGDEEFLGALVLSLPGERVHLMDMAVAHWFTGLAAVTALAAAFLVSYTRARAEGLGLECRVGWFERPERLILLLGAGAFGEKSAVMPWALVILAVLSSFTAFQRVAHVRKRIPSRD